VLVQDIEDDTENWKSAIVVLGDLAVTKKPNHFAL
jgi:hypothetical protein